METTNEQNLLTSFCKTFKKEYGHKCTIELKDTDKFENCTLISDLKFNKNSFSVYCEWRKKRYSFKYSSIKSFFQNAYKNDESFQYFVNKQ